MIVDVFGNVGYFVPLLTFLTLVARLDVLRALVAANVEMTKLGLQILMFLINLCAFQFKFPFLGALLMLAEFALVAYYIWEINVVSLAIQSFLNSCFGLFAFSAYAEASADSDQRIKELQEMLNMVLEDNKKMTIELESLRAEVDRNSQSLFHQLAMMTGGSSIAFEVAVLVLLMILVCIAIGLVVYVICRQSGRQAEYQAIRQESYRAGSEFFNAATPKAVIQIFDADVNTPLGHGTIVQHPVVKTQAILLTAKHVVDNADSISVRAGKFSISLTTISLTDLGHDIVATFLPMDQVKSILGLAKKDIFTLNNRAVDKPTGVSAHAEGKSSLGTLRKGTAFGTLAYSGSTLPGFSGTPYYAGNIVYGIHTGSCASTNLGVDSGLIIARLTAHLKRNNVAVEVDDSIEYVYDGVKEELKNGKDVKWNYYGGDQYEVLFKGKYYVLYNDDMAELGLIERNSPIKPDSAASLSFTDSENYQRGPAPVQGPGATAARVAAQLPASTTSKDSQTSPPHPQELTSPSTSLPQQISAQLGNLSTLIQELVRKQPAAPKPVSVAGNGKIKGRGTMKGPSAFRKSTSSMLSNS